jgi:hypothetical protein
LFLLWFVAPWRPWFARGGIFSLGLGAGVFTFSHAYGSSDSDGSFREVLIFTMIRKFQNKI